MNMYDLIQTNVHANFDCSQLSFLTCVFFFLIRLCGDLAYDGFQSIQYVGIPTCSSFRINMFHGYVFF